MRDKLRSFAVNVYLTAPGQPGNRVTTPTMRLDPTGRTKVSLKIEQIARLRVGGMADRRICEVLGIKQGGLSRILSLDAYKKAEVRILGEVTGAIDSVLAQRAELLKRKFADEVPNALSAIFETVKQKTDLRTRLAASLEVLDRDPQGTFVKGKKPESKSPYDAVAIPQAVLDAAVLEGNKVVRALNEQEPAAKPEPEMATSTVQ